MSRYFKATLLFSLIGTAFLTGCSESSFEHENQLQAEKLNLAKQQEYVDNLKKQIVLEQQKTETSIPLQVDSQREQIGFLASVISQARYANSDLSTAASEAIDREQFETEQLQNEMTTQIQGLSQNINRLEEQITPLLAYTLRTNEQEARLAELTSDLEIQKQQYQRLQGQLRLIHEEASAKTNRIYSSLESERQQIAGYTAELQSELNARRSYLINLRDYSNRTNVYLNNLNQMLRNAEQELKSQQEKVRSLEQTNK